VSGRNEKVKRCQIIYVNPLMFQYLWECGEMLSPIFVGVKTNIVTRDQ